MTESAVRQPLPPELCTHLGFVLSKAYQELHARFDAETGSYGIVPRHLGVLLLVTRRGALRQSEIADALRLDRTTVTYLVDDLEARGWVERGRDPEDRRAHAVSATAEGERVLEELRPHVEAAERAFLEPLSAAESNQLRSLLARLV